MTRPYFSSLRARLALLILLAVLPALAVVLYMGWRQRRAADARAAENTLRVVRLVSANHDDILEGARHMLIALAQVPEVRRGASCAPFLGGLLKQYRSYVNLGAVDLEGNVYCSAQPLPGPVSLAQETWFAQVVKTASFAIGNYRISPIVGKARVNFGYPILDDRGSLRAVVFAGLDLSWLEQLFSATELPAGAELTVIDRNGVVLVQQPRREGRIGKRWPDDSMLEAILSRHEGSTEGLDQEGVLRLFAFTPLGRIPESSLYVVVGIPKQIVLAGARSSLGLGLSALVPVIAVFAILWLGLELTILRPVKELQTATRRLRAGDLSARVSGNFGRSELGDLAQAFDDMADSQEKTNQAKADFTAMIVHDLRSPLAAVVGAASIVREKLAGPITEEQDHWLAKIEANCRHLTNLVNDFLDLSKLEAGRIELIKQKVDVRQLIENGLENFALLARNKNISFTRRFDQELPGIEADARRLEQVFVNLLSNAVKFTPNGGQIEVGAAREENNRIRVWVKDNGLGISAGEVAALFQKYRQAAGAQQIAEKGTGLGLVICKMIVQAHGGKIWAESAENQGATFIFSLPV